MLHIIVNPVAGRKKKKIVDPRITLKNYLDEKKIEYMWYESQSMYEPGQIAKEISTKYDNGTIVVMGGDGTLSEVINGIVDISKWNIGLIPAGSGNDFARVINLSSDPIKSFQKIENNSLHEIDYMIVDGKRCVNAAGTGIDLLVLEKFEKYNNLQGSFRYLVALVSALLSFKWYEFDMSIDGGEFVHKKGFMAAVCNGSTIGGGIPICPGAIVDDGMLEIAYYDNMPKIKILFALMKLLKGNGLKLKINQHHYCETVSFKSKTPFKIQIDGNISEPSCEYNFKIIKKGLKIYY